MPLSTDRRFGPGRSVAHSPEVTNRACCRLHRTCTAANLTRRFSLYEGDRRRTLAAMPAESVDTIFADPPYNLSNGGFTCKSGLAWLGQQGCLGRLNGLRDDHEFNLQWLQACQRVLRPNGTIWVTGTYHVIYSVGFAIQQLGFKMLNEIAWFKPSVPPNLSLPLLRREP